MCLSWRTMQRSSASAIVVRVVVGSGPCYDLLDCPGAVRLVLGPQPEAYATEIVAGKKRGGKSSCRIAITFYFSARAILPGRSWRRQFSTGRASLISRLIAQAAIRRAPFAPKP